MLLPDCGAEQKKKGQRLSFFGTKEEVIFAFDDGELNTHSRVLLLNPDGGHETVYGDKDKKVIETAVVVVFGEIGLQNWAFPTVLSGRAKLAI